MNRVMPNAPIAPVMPFKPRLLRFPSISESEMEGTGTSRPRRKLLCSSMRRQWTGSRRPRHKPQFFSAKRPATFSAAYACRNSRS